MKKCSSTILMLCLFLLFASSVYAEVKSEFGATFRLRQEVWDNVVNLNTSASQPDRNFFRFRSSVWGKADFNQNIGAYLRITNEAKYYIGDYEVNNQRLEEDEIIFDNLYADFRNVFGLPVDMRIGRQDFLGPNGFGEGFLLLDGNPGDGSRSFYFNAVRATWKINKNHSVDLVYLSNAKTDTFLPSVRTSTKASGYFENKRLLNGSDEKGFVVYSKNKIAGNLVLEPYYIFKNEDPVSTSNPGLDLHTVGLRAAYNIDAWRLRGEYAHQFGEFDNGRDRRGDGGYFFVGRKFEQVALKPEFEVGFVYLSGDKDAGNASDDYEGWNPLFSRAPIWNELMIYTFITETASQGGPIPGYWTNMLLYKAAVKLNFSPNTSLALSYQYLESDEPTSGLTTSMFSNSGTDRGHLPTALLSHKFSKKVDGFLQWEYFMPKDFYSSAAHNATFFRWQLQFKI